MGFPEWLNDPARQRRINLLARQIWEAQGEKCAGCGEPLAFENATKNSYSFDVVCQRCKRQPKTIMVIDDIEGEEEGAVR